MQAHPDRSGIVALPDGHDAFAARALLADAAERTLDVRYYIWHNDMSGTLLFTALRRAADRGVRVRLLLDDNNTTGLDQVLAALDAHANIEVRLFNPFKHRRWRLLGYLTDFKRLNRRMHNKSLTADGQATIIGGRNVGDEYFDAGQGGAPWFVDLDVLAIGPVVSEVSRDFDRYWASASSIPAARLLPRATATSIAAVAADAARVEHHPDAAAYVEALARSSFVRDLLAHRLTFDWAATRMLSDDPAKGLGRAPEDALLWHRLKEILHAPMRELRLVSPYFVPGSAGVEALATIAGQGVKITVLTNALEATDVAVVHAGYAKRRKSLLAAGITLFELKRGSSSSRKRVDWTGRSGSGSSASSLHAKTFAIDRSRVFVGSFNFDPRSARLNTEMGFVIDSSALADALAQRFADEVPARAYRVGLGDTGQLHWIDRHDGVEVVQEEEPGTGVWRRLAVAVLSVLPIEWLL
ncbi:MAG TPA: phospholipase D family protein [Gemmatimonadales bacterium]|nr:phospholipase D family protein [Gemmatimonadales bacterium]